MKLKLNGVSLLWRKKNFRRAFQILWVTVVFLCISFAIGKNWKAISDVEWSLSSVGLICAALLSSFLRRLAGGMRWAWIIQLFKTDGLPISLRDNLRVYFITNLGTYLPGTYWFIPARMMMNSKYGLSNIQTGICTVFEHLMLVLSGALLGILGMDILVSALHLPLASFRWMFAAIIFGLISIHPAVIRFLMNTMAKILREPLGSYHFSYTTTLLHLLWSVLIWLLGSIALLLLALVFVPTLSWQDLPAFSSVFAISWLLGFFTPFAPGGLGVREGFMGLAFGLLGIPIGVSMVIAMLSRLLIVVEDLFWAAYSVLLLKESRVDDAACKSSFE
ncbi:lysylphosphatidylglycerol synthase domain-containing protein [Desulfogranum japonicum]|uniref:lysylphosphatidylglycerol synthase domain-containing protein n=1 Tax=Desulfogranum japonicum TaxID=231447 RepID=UPI0004174153|nr:lysylphosphatidylglycerol synthase domain-containing protein [Desulfogranum japonicum]